MKIEAGAVKAKKKKRTQMQERQKRAMKTALRIPRPPPSDRKRELGLVGGIKSHVDA